MTPVLARSACPRKARVFISARFAAAYVGVARGTAAACTGSPVRIGRSAGRALWKTAREAWPAPRLCIGNRQGGAGHSCGIAAKIVAGEIERWPMPRGQCRSLRMCALALAQRHGRRRMPTGGACVWAAEAGSVPGPCRSARHPLRRARKFARRSRRRSRVQAAWCETIMRIRISGEVESIAASRSCARSPSCGWSCGLHAGLSAGARKCPCLSTMPRTRAIKKCGWQSGPNARVPFVRRRRRPPRPSLPIAAACAARRAPYAAARGTLGARLHEPFMWRCLSRIGR